MSEKDNEGFLPSHVAYENLLSYRKAEIVYDLTYGFCCRFLKPEDRTIDQMVLAGPIGLILLSSCPVGFGPVY